MAAEGGAGPPGGAEEEEDDLGYRLFPDRKKKPQSFLVRSLFTFHNRCQLMLRMSLETSKGPEPTPGSAGSGRGLRQGRRGAGARRCCCSRALGRAARGAVGSPTPGVFKERVGAYTALPSFPVSVF